MKYWVYAFVSKDNMAHPASPPRETFDVKDPCPGASSLAPLGRLITSVPHPGIDPGSLAQ